MADVLAAQVDFITLNLKRLKRYWLLVGVLLVILIAYLAINDRYLVLGMLFLSPVVLAVVTIPRLALYQYVFVLFLYYAVEYTVPIMMIDISAGLVVIAGLVNFLCSDRLPRQIPPLVLNFAALLTAIFVTGLFGYDAMTSVHPLIRVTFLVLTFLSIFRLARSVPVDHLIHLFFWLCAVHSMVVLVPFILSGGEERSFGLAPKIFDELAMLAFPTGIALYLWAGRRLTFLYLIASLVVLLALVATQSRAPIALSVVAAVVVVVISYRRSGSIRDASNANSGSAVRHRISVMGLIGVGLAALLIGAKPELLGMVWSRFDELMTFDPSGAVLVRITLWQSAIMAFLDNPILGIGPGNFRHLREIYPHMNLDPVYYYGRGLSAHNLMLHYLAEAGLVGATAVAALFINQFRLGLKCCRQAKNVGDIGWRLALMVITLLFLVTTFVEAGWLWAGYGYVFVFFAALTARVSAPNDSYA